MLPSCYTVYVNNFVHYLISWFTWMTKIHENNARFHEIFYKTNATEFNKFGAGTK